MALQERSVKKPPTELYGKYSRESSHSVLHQARLLVSEYYNNHGSPWSNDLSDAEKWLSEQEMKRLESGNIKRPSTK